MALFLGVTVLSLALAYFCNNAEQVQLHIDSREKSYLSGQSTRQEVFNKWICAAIYLILMALSACRIASGNDYWGYAEMFNLISQGRPVSSEPGFNGVVLLMQFIFGQEKYLPIFGLFSILTVFFFVKSIYDQGEWFVFSLFLFMMNGYYFSSFNSIRYYFVLGIAMFSMKYVLKGEYGKFILWIVAAAFFHKSVLVVIPTYLIAAWLAKKGLKKWQIVVGVLLILSLIFGRDLYRKIIFVFYPYYEGSQFDHVEYSVTNIGKCAGTLFVAAVCYKRAIKDNMRNQFYLYLTLIGFVIYTLGAFIPEVSRIGYYFMVAHIFLLPNMLKSMKDGIWKKTFMAVVILAFIGHFTLFLKTAYSVDIRLLPYLNWIFNN